jgi:hypothetical protein
MPIRETAVTTTATKVKRFFMFILLPSLALLGHGELQPRAASLVRLSKESAIYSSGVLRLRERTIGAHDVAVLYFRTG